MPTGEVPINYDFNNGSNAFVRGLMPHHCPGCNYPYSRDWQDIDCDAIACINNRNKKCSVPFLAIIGEDGICINFKIRENK